MIELVTFDPPGTFTPAHLLNVRRHPDRRAWVLYTVPANEPIRVYGQSWNMESGDIWLSCDRVQSEWCALRYNKAWLGALVFPDWDLPGGQYETN